MQGKYKTIKGDYSAGRDVYPCTNVYTDDRFNRIATFYGTDHRQNAERYCELMNKETT